MEDLSPRKCKNNHIPGGHLKCSRQLHSQPLVLLAEKAVALFYVIQVSEQIRASQYVERPGLKCQSHASRSVQQAVSWCSPFSHNSRAIGST